MKYRLKRIQLRALVHKLRKSVQSQIRKVRARGKSERTVKVLSEAGVQAQAAISVGPPAVVQV